MKQVDSRLHNHLQQIEFMPELSLLKWLRCLYSREFTLDATMTIWDYLFADVDYQLVQERKYEKMVPNAVTFYHREDYHTNH